VPYKSLKLKTPEEAFTSVKPHLGHLCVLGCTAYYHILDVKCNKLEPKTLITILVDYDENSKAYHCYHPSTRTIVLSRNVHFDIPLPETTEPLEDHPLLDNLLTPTPTPNSIPSVFLNTPLPTTLFPLSIDTTDPASPSSTLLVHFPVPALLTYQT